MKYIIKNAKGLVFLNEPTEKGKLFGKGEPKVLSEPDASFFLRYFSRSRMVPFADPKLMQFKAFNIEQIREKYLELENVFGVSNVRRFPNRFRFIVDYGQFGMEGSHEITKEALMSADLSLNMDGDSTIWISAFPIWVIVSGV